MAEEDDFPDLQPGDFTRAIDAERLLRATGAGAQEREMERMRVETEQRERAAQSKASARQVLIDEHRQSIVEMLADRVERIQRISSSASVKVDTDGGDVSYCVPNSPERPAAKILFFCKLNDSRQAFDIGSVMDIEGVLDAKKDQLAPINIKKVSDKLKQIEVFRDNKLLDFVRAYLDSGNQ